MDIGKNIAKYRKLKHITQDELGTILGVSNQAVSKWENGVTMPDILLLPEIAKALDITLDLIYGIEQPISIKSKVTADNFPNEAFDLLHHFFYKTTAMRFTHIGSSDEEQLKFQRDDLKNGRYIGCISNIGGAVIISDSISFIDRTYKLPKSETIFSHNRMANSLKHLSDKNLRKVLEYEYKVNFEKSKDKNNSFTVHEISEGCDLSEEAAEKALELLTLLNLNEASQTACHETEYYFILGNVLYAVAIFKLVEMMTYDKSWIVIRDTSMISDYDF